MTTLGLSWTDQRRDYGMRTCDSPPCTEVFMALASYQRYCSPRCQNRAAGRQHYARWGWGGKPREVQHA